MIVAHHLDSVSAENSSLRRAQAGSLAEVMELSISLAHFFVSGRVNPKGCCGCGCGPNHSEVWKQNPLQIPQACHFHSNFFLLGSCCFI